MPGRARVHPAGGRAHRLADGAGAEAGRDQRLTRDALIERVRRGVVGDGQELAGPFGARRITYADWTASGRALGFVEDVIRDQVLPWYANTHTESSGTGRHTTRLREQARQVIHQAVGGTDQDLVIFCGSGATAAVAKLVGLLELGGRAAGPGPRPLVLVGPFEHHSNLLPWRESAAEVIAVGEDANGQLDLAELEAQLAGNAGRPLVVGSVSAASNVTGILTGADRVAALLHRHGALSVWDYSAAAPYVPIRMAESRPGAGDHKDAVFFSPHKLIGGPQTPGVLAVNRGLARLAALLHRALDRWRRNPNLELLGIQARGGCSCAGPYGHRLLGIDPDRSRP